MKKMIDKVEKYIRETIGVTVAPKPWEKSTSLPQYLRERYRFFLINILGKDLLLMLDTRAEEQTPAVAGKHMDMVRSRGGVELVYVPNTVTSYNRRRLIGQALPFIAPGNQMYLPMLGIDLREHFRQLRQKKIVFSPSTQALVLDLLLGKQKDTVTPAESAHRLGYSPMTMTRAFDELEAADIGEHSFKGKERHIYFPELGRQLWERALPYLNTPVRKSVSVVTSREITANLAGESALAQYTMLAEPTFKIFAFSTEEWKRIVQSGDIEELKFPEPGCLKIQLWKYSPDLFAYEGKVDRLSLYLSLKDETDERVASALDDLLEGMEW